VLPSPWREVRGKRLGIRPGGRRRSVWEGQLARLGERGCQCAGAGASPWLRPLLSAPNDILCSGYGVRSARARPLCLPALPCNPRHSSVLHCHLDGRH
jgi:hypothetical protein